MKSLSLLTPKSGQLLFVISDAKSPHFRKKQNKTIIEVIIFKNWKKKSLKIYNILYMNIFACHVHHSNMLLCLSVENKRCMLHIEVEGREAPLLSSESLETGFMWWHKGWLIAWKCVIMEKQVFQATLQVTFSVVSTTINCCQLGHK